MASLFGHETDLSIEQIDKIKDITGNDRINSLRILRLIIECQDDTKDKMLNESLQMMRKTYTGDYVREYFIKYQSKHPDKKKMEMIKEVSEMLGVSQSAIKKHIYKK